MNKDTPHSIPALVTLRIAVAVTAVATSISILRYGGPVLSWLWMNLGLSEDLALNVEHSAAYALLASAPLVFWSKAWPALKVIAYWLLFTAVCATLIGTWYPWLTIPAHAARYLAPLALLGLQRRDARSRKVGEWLLRVGIGATFIAHGIEALLHKPQFLDYLHDASAELLSMKLEPATAGHLLTAIGVVDVAVGLAVLVPKRWRPLVLWLAFWGFLTAAARIVYMGWENHLETLIRLANGAVPLTLWLLWAERPNEHDDAEEQ